MEGIATKTASDLALQGAGWSVAVILGIVVWLLFKELRAENRRMAEILVKVTEVALTSVQAAQANAAGLKDVEATVSVSVAAIQALSREQENELRELRHAVNNAASIGQAVAARLERSKGE